MIIKELHEPAHVGGKFTLVFDDGSKLRVMPSVIADFGLYSGLELDVDAMSALQKAAGTASAKNRAVRIISAADVSEKELQHRLVQKGESEEDAAKAVKWLTELNLVNDLETAKHIVQQGIAKGYGIARIRQLLYEKRIPKQYWETVLSDFPDPGDAIDKFLTRRFAGVAPDKAEVKRAVDALVRRGHSWQDIQAGLRRYTNSIEDYPEG